MAILHHFLRDELAVKIILLIQSSSSNVIIHPLTTQLRSAFDNLKFQISHVTQNKPSSLAIYFILFLVNCAADSTLIQSPWEVYHFGYIEAFIVQHFMKRDDMSQGR